MIIDDMSNDEIITAATLLGCAFADVNKEYPETPSTKSRFFVESCSGEFHPLEREREAKSGVPGWPSRISLARDYVEWCLRQKS